MSTDREQTQGESRGFVYGDAVRINCEVTGALTGDKYPAGTTGRFARGHLITADVFIGPYDMAIVPGEELEHV